MFAEHPAPMANEANVETEKPVGGFLSDKKNQGKVPKKIHKAEREKLKRDHLNELFLELGCALEPARQNNGKATVLGDATRLLRDLLAHVESLRKENAALVTESRYVTVEKNELRDENAVLEAEIEKLQNELQKRMQADPVWSNSTDATPSTLPQPTSTALPMQQPPVVGPVYVIPLHQDLEPYRETRAVAPPKPPSNVRRPHARYPTPDSWPLQLLSGHPRTTEEGEHSGGSTTTNSGEKGSDKV